MGKDNQISETDIDWENRILCSDGHCIGVIGTDGCCKECGRPYEGDLPAALTEDEVAAATAPFEAEISPEAPGEREPLEADLASDSDAEWENRRLCIDGNCIGVIGPDGKCKECGRPYEP